MNTKYLLVLYALGWMLFGNACSKKIETKSVEDYSVQEDIQLYKMIALGQKVFVVGGNKFTSSFIACIEQQSVTPRVLPNTGLQTAIYDIACHANGTITAVSNSSGIWFSQDSGTTWQFAQSNIWKEMKGIAFTHPDSVCIVGKGDTKYGFVVRGGAQGVGLDAASATYNFELDEIRSTPNGTLFACGYGAMLKSSDNGLHWDFTDAKNDWFRAMYWRNDALGWAIGYEGSIIKTTDAGMHWQCLRNANNTVFKRLRLLGIHGVGSVLAVVGEKGLLMLSYDDGEHWKTVALGTKQDLHAVLFENEYTLWVCGNAGALFKITLP